MRAIWNRLRVDLRFVLRRLRRAPGFAAASTLMLGAGIALSVAMFGIVYGVLLGSLPYPDSSRVVVVESANAEQDVEHDLLTPAEATRLEEMQQEGAGPFEGLGYYTWGGLTVFDGTRPREIATINVSRGLLPALAVPPLHGRWFGEEDFAGGSDALILSEPEWRRLFGGDPGAIGRRIETDDGAFRVIGVMPAQFATPSPNVGAWRPYGPWGEASSQPWFWNARFMNVMARLPTAAERGAIAQQLAVVGQELRERYSLPESGWRLDTRPALDALVGDVRAPVWGALAIALLVLLIGCANVAIMLDARECARRHEQALVQALGASRSRLRRTLLLEVALVSTVGVALGVLLAWSGVEALRALAEGSLPRADAIALDGRVIAFALVLASVLPLVALIAGSLRPRADAAEAIRSGGRGVVAGARSAPRRWLPALGIALSTISLVTASALAVSLVRLQRVDPGFRTEHVQALQMWRSGGSTAWRPFADRMQELLRALPGVEEVALTTSTPLSPVGSFVIDLQVQGREQPEPYQASLRRVSPEYLSLLDIPLVAGRGFEAGDGEGSEAVAVVSRELARRAFPDGDALGRIIGLPLGSGERVPYRVVGIAEDVRNEGLRLAPTPEVLVPFAHTPWVAMTFLVRTTQPLPGIQAQMADAVWQIDPREGITRQFALQDDVDVQLQAARFFARTVGAFALAALLLAAFGVYAVAALQQQRRVAEFGLRLAVGARPRALAAQVLGESMRSVAIGVVFGAAGAWALLQMLQAQLFGLEAGRLSVVAAGVAVLVLASLVAALLPAWRAARTDPNISLRCE